MQVTEHDNTYIFQKFASTVVDPNERKPAENQSANGDGNPRSFGAMIQGAYPGQTTADEARVPCCRDCPGHAVQLPRCNVEGSVGTAKCGVDEAAVEETRKKPEPCPVQSNQRGCVGLGPIWEDVEGPLHRKLSGLLVGYRGQGLIKKLRQILVLPGDIRDEAARCERVQNS